MKVTVTILPLLFASLAASVSPFGGSQTILVEGKVDIPGENPFELCDPNAEEILKIDSVNLTPYPPVGGKPLTIKVAGNFAAAVTDGAYIDTTAYFGLVRLFNRRLYLCEQIDEKCPLVGDSVVTFHLDMPSEIPLAKFKVSVNAYSEEDEDVTCVTGVFDFTKPF